MLKATAVAPASVALIKYWGRKDEILRLPLNGSIAINMSGLLTTTTVEFDSALNADTVVIDGEEKQSEAARVIKHLDRVRKMAGIGEKAKVVSKNSFPSSTGLSSSSSGFAALTVAASVAAGLRLDQKQLSILARQGSGSACRSIPDGFVEWLDGDSSETSYSVSLYPADYWPVADIVAIVSAEKKDVSSSEGHKTAGSSPLFSVRQQGIQHKIDLMKEALRNKDFKGLGELTEAEALEFHALTMTSNPSLIYLIPDSLRMIKEVRKWRGEGLPAYFNLNTGQDVHIMCEQENKDEIVSRLKKLDFVRDIIVNEPAKGARIVEEHLY